jgi:pyruvate dehydrogenase E2 component (dihydrolipoamide acetyltransferase)
MAETQQPSPAPAATPAAPAAPATPEPAPPSGLEKVYSDFGIEEKAAEFQPQSPQPAQPAAPAAQPVPFKAPDPFSPDFGAYQAQLANGVSALHQSLQQTQQKLTQLDQQLNRRQVEADIKSAAKTLSAKAGIDSDVAEVAFEAQARKDPRLLQIWNNRAKNPKALEAA